MRFVRVVLALVFGLAMAGPETHACPVHSDAPVAGHHQGAGGGGGHQEKAHCTCPQACCPTAQTVSLPPPEARWVAASAPVLAVDLESVHPVVLLARKHFLPFALAPPQNA
jgi:hypothetical protein